MPTSALRVGVAAVKLSPCGPNPDYDGPITASGVWGESYTDVDGNGRWDDGEPFVDDPVNTTLDPRSDMKYDGIFLAGFGNDRIATGCHDDIWARALVVQGPTRKVALVSVDFVGMITHGLYSGFAHARALVDPGLGLDEIIFSSTHSHEGPDTLGLWGVVEVIDGKFPRYLQFVDRQIARPSAWRRHRRRCARRAWWPRAPIPRNRPSCAGCRCAPAAVRRSSSMRSCAPSGSSTAAARPSPRWSTGARIRNRSRTRTRW